MLALHELEAVALKISRYRFLQEGFVKTNPLLAKVSYRESSYEIATETRKQGK